MRRVIFLLFVCGWARIQAQTSDLAHVRAALDALRRHRGQHRETRGASPELTVIKHRLRDWAETQLAGFGPAFDEDTVNRQFQERMWNAGLVCPDGCSTDALGYADPVRVRRQGGLAMVQTSVGIACGYDDSAYLYEWTGGAWRSILETEQNTYTKAGYLPQTIYSLQASDPSSRGERLVLSLGSRPGCSSAFQPIYYRLWRISPGGAKPRPLFDASETVYMGDYPPVRGTVSPGDVRLEFTVGGTGYGYGHQAVRRFEVRGGAVRQVEPIAPTPRDFVEEWLDAPWKQSVQWSETASLEAWHTKFHRDDGMGDFPDPPARCPNQQDLWQIGIRLQGVAGETYHLVRWGQPDHFTMAAISDRPVCN